MVLQPAPELAEAFSVVRCDTTTRRPSRFREPYVHALLPILVGGSAYLLSRSSGLLMFAWLNRLGLMGWIQSVRGWAQPLTVRCPGWLFLSAPAALWNYALVSWIGWVWRDRRCAEKKWWILCGAMLGPLSEIGQGLGWAPGTFDPVDLALYIAAVLLAVLRIWYWERHHVEEESSNNVRTPLGRALGHGYR